MVTVLNLKCANCGANLEISPDTTDFACGYCGAAQIVERRGGTVALRLVTDAISKVQVGTDKTAAELAIRRLKDEITELDVPYRQLQAEVNKLKSDNFAVAGTAAIGGLIFIICPLANYDYSGGAIFVVLLLIIAGAIGYYYYRKYLIDAAFAEDAAPLLAKHKELTARIEELKKIADS